MHLGFRGPSFRIGAGILLLAASEQLVAAQPVAIPPSAEGAGGAFLPKTPALGLQDSLAGTASTQPVGVHFGRGAEGLVLSLWSCERKCAPGLAQVELIIPEAAASLKRRVQKVQLEHGGRVLSIRFGEEENHYAVLVVGAAIVAGASPGTPQVLLKGWSGLKSKTATNLRLEKRKTGARMILEGRAKTALCGRTIPSFSRIFDEEKLKFRSVQLPPLSRGERVAAPVLSARPMALDKAGLLVRLERASHDSAQAPVDGDRQLPWMRGYEYVELRAPISSSTNQLIVEVAEVLTQPAELWLVTSGGLRRLRLEPSPNKTYLLDVPLGKSDACVALVQPFEGIPLVEVMGYVQLEEGVTTEDLVKQLSQADPGLAPFSLSLRGSETAQALSQFYPRMSTMARTRSVEVAQLLPGSSGVPVHVAAVEHGSEMERARAVVVLEQWQQEAAEAIVARLPQAQSAGKIQLSNALVELSPEHAARALAAQLATGGAADRLATRKAISRVAAAKSGARALGLLFDEQLQAPEKGNSHLSRFAQVELIRAIDPYLSQWGGSSTKLLVMRAQSASFEDAYRLMPSVARMAPQEASLMLMFEKWLKGEASTALSAVQRDALSSRALELLNDQPDSSMVDKYNHVVRSLLVAENMRVRKNAWLLVARQPESISFAEFNQGLVKDKWPQVRAASAQAAANYSSQTEGGQKLASLLADRLLRDKEALARRGFAQALAHHGGEKPLRSLRKALQKDPYYEVRTDAAIALGKLCDQESLDVLTKLTMVLAQAPAGEGQILLGLGALTSVVRLNPPDLERRIAPLRSSRVSGVLRHQVELRIDEIQADEKGGACSS